MDRLVRRYVNKNMKSAGVNDISSAPKTIFVRNFEPSTPMRRSASSLSRLRSSTNVSATNNRKTSADNAVRRTVCCTPPGLRNVRLNACCDTRTKNRRTMAMPRPMIRALRSTGLELTLGTGTAEIIGRLRTGYEVTTEGPCHSEHSEESLPNPHCMGTDRDSSLCSK